ncbi:MAG: hypothetical protein KDC87_03310 [Planctomycetes bacterium]|nr:hypothetical protein [Planctomycetota bacterium]MCB9872104.1 hypothetical protein [Planctomycetota bacterium]
MRQIFINVDQLLRGRFTRPEQLRDGAIDIPARTLIIAGLLMGVSYGIFMGLYGATRPQNAAFLQLLTTAVKVPLLFLLTLFVTLPSLYVLSALGGSRLGIRQTMRLLLAAITINLAVLASLGPVVAFFTLSTSSYPFMLMLNVVFFTVAGIAGIVFLRRALVHVFAPPESQPEGQPEPIGPQQPGGVQPPPWAAAQRRQGTDPGLVVFRAWIVVYGVVGAQMGWVLRPFVGTPDLPFSVFRDRQSNFFLGVLNAIGDMFR